MKLKEYLNELNRLVNKYPDVLEMKVITASDDEGNSYQCVLNNPSIAQVESLEKCYNLDLIDIWQEDSNISLEECNVVILN